MHCLSALYGSYYYHFQYLYYYQNQTKQVGQLMVNHVHLFYYVNKLSFMCKVHNFFELSKPQKFYCTCNLSGIKITMGNWGINENPDLKNKIVAI